MTSGKREMKAREEESKAQSQVFNPELLSGISGLEAAVSGSLTGNVHASRLSRHGLYSL